MSRKQRDWLIGTAIVFIMITLIMVMMNRQTEKSLYDGGASLSSKGDKIAVIELNGPIYDSRSLVKQFKKYGDHASVKAVLFRINSPGGGISPSQEIYEAAKRVRDAGKPVVASFSSVAASGGYYVACGADTIMANPGSTTGSIGVIVEWTNIKELLDKIGVDVEVIKSGRFKDTGSPHRGITPEERRYLQSYVDDAYQQFIDVVSSERGLKRSAVEKIADGRVFTGRQAQDLGLVDLLGDYHDAVQLAAKLGGIDGEPTLVKESHRRYSLFDLMFEESTRLFRGARQMQTLYQWR